MLSSPHDPNCLLGPIQLPVQRVVADIYSYSKATTMCSCPQDTYSAWNCNATPLNSFSVEHKHRDIVLHAC